jgi:hypothetical protein
MGYRSPESKRIPDVKVTCFVENAIAPPFHDGHKICIAHPVRSGLQSALIVPPAGRVIDTLVIIPPDVRHSTPRIDHIYGNYLGFIKWAQRKVIERIRNNNFVMLWEDITRSEAPFRYLTLERLTKELRPLLQDPLSFTRRTALVALRTAWARSFQLVIPHVQDRVVRNQPKLREYWWILDHWSRWEERKLDLYARLIAYRQEFPDEQIDDQNYRQKMNTFAKMCSGFLRLKYSVKKTTKKMAAVRLLDLKAEREKRDSPK